MRDANSKESAPRSKFGPAAITTLLLSVGGVALWNSTVAASAKKIEEQWKKVTDRWGYEFAFLEFTEPELHTLADAVTGEVLQIPWLERAFPAECFVATTTKRDTTKDGITTWRGTLEHTLFGYSVLVASKDGVAGFVQRGGTVYVIEPLPTKKMVITQIFHRQLPAELPVPVLPPEPELARADARAMAAAFPEPPEPDYPIELLLLLPETSPRAQSYTEDPTSELVERLFEARLYDAYNTTFDPKLKPEPEVTFHVVMKSVEYVPKGGKLGEDLDWLGTDAVVDLREEAKADLVGLLVDVPKAKVKIGGVTYAPPSDEKNWFLAVEIHSALAQYSLEHEIGHCMGMLHDVSEGGPAHCYYGHMIELADVHSKEQLVGRTIMMGRHGTSAPRVPVFSHPGTDPATNVRYGVFCDSGSEGNADEALSKYMMAPANNQGMILENAVSVSRYRLGHPTGD